MVKERKEIVIDVKKTGQRIKENCDCQGITVKQIQQELNIGSFQSVYSWFQGKTLPSMDNFYALCKLLHVSMDSMIVEQEEYSNDIIFAYLEGSNLSMLTRLCEYEKRYVAMQSGKGLC